MALVQIVLGVVNAKLLSEDEAVKTLIQSTLSYMVEGAEQSEAFKTHRWDGKSSFFEWNRGVFPAGFISMVHRALESAGHHVQITRKEAPAPLGPENPVIDPYDGDPRYDYQPETVRRLLRHRSMIAQVATGGGKSRICNLAVARIKRRTLFLTTRGVLMWQMHKAFNAAMKHRFKSGEKDLAGKRVGVLGDSQWSPSDYINVGMVQTLAARLDNNSTRKETIELLQKFELVILEEAHEAGGNSYFEIMKHCANAHYRLALTATPFMRGDAESNMRLMACSGAIGIKVTEKELIDKGILATPYFKTIKVGYNPDKVAYQAAEKNKKAAANTQMGWNSTWQRAYKLGIVYNKARNDAIINETVRAARLKLPVMILVQHKSHGGGLYWALKERGIAVEWIYGESKQGEREAALKRLGEGDTQVLIGSTILDVGVDAPAVGVIVLAGGGKAEVALRQRIGRGLRAKKNMPNVAFIVDFEDKTNSHLYEHFISRRRIIQATPGFVERLLPIGADFDMERIASPAALTV